MAKKQLKCTNEIKPGMPVEATQGDLGEEDISKPKVKNVIYDKNGHVEKIVIEKGLLFKKDLVISAERIQNIKHATNPEDGKVSIDAREAEIEALNTLGSEELVDRNIQAQQKRKDILDNIFWQVQGEKEEKRSGSTKQKIRFAALDIAVGVVSGNFVALFYYCDNSDYNFP